MIDDLHSALQSNFGHDAFRSHQEEIIRQVIAGQDTLGVLPTGAGKSLCYQLPALLLPRPTLVISPLIALMQDQLDGLPPAIYSSSTLINSSLDQAEVNRRILGIETGVYRLIYAAPERLRQEEFLRLLQRLEPSLVVVDEAHCVSVWGHDFRPDYLFIRKAIQLLQETGAPPILLALTATATSAMQVEIADQLGRRLQPITASVFRPNLRLEVFPCANADEKMRRLATVCRDTPGAGIVYANSRDRCERLALFLSTQGVKASFYHAGLDRETRRATQEKFMLGGTRVMVATVAFGMGVDKSNVRFVVHFTLPESLEAYSQESGRAGRDGKPSRCVLLVAPSDKTNLNRWMRDGQVTLPDVRDTYRALKERIVSGIGYVSPEEVQTAVFGADAADSKYGTKLRVAISVLEQCGLVARHLETGRTFQIEILPTPAAARADIESLLAARRVHEDLRLADMLAYAEGSGCRHASIARHFDQEFDSCRDACDRCLGTAAGSSASRTGAPSGAELPDIGRVILECIVSLPYPVGRTKLSKVLTGAADSPFPSDRCRQFGRLEGFSLAAVRRFLDSLAAAGFLNVDIESEYPVVRITPSGVDALRGREILLANSATAPSAAPRTRSGTVVTSDRISPYYSPTEDEEDRFERLRAWRRIEAERQSMPPFVIFHDTTLRELARVNPSDLSAMAQVSGIGPRKMENYGAAIIQLLAGAGSLG